MSQIKVLKRANVNVMCDWVVTAPEDLTEEELPVFFNECYKFLNARYGKENVISAPVHMDETSPHLHYNFVPVVKDKKKGIPKLSAKECITRKDLNTFHQDLTKHMMTVFGKDKVVVKRSELDRLNKAVEDAQLISSNRDAIIADLTEQKRKADRKNEKAEEHLKTTEEKTDIIISDAKTEADNMTSAICSEKSEWEKKRSEQQLALDNREKELSEKSEELAKAEQLVNKQAEINEASAERNLAFAAQIEQAGLLIEEERRDLMKQKNSHHEYYGEIIFEKNVELNSKEAEIADLCNTISEKNSKIANLDALIDEKESKIQTLNCRIVSNENAHEQWLSAALEQQEHILTEKHEKEISELNGKINVLETTLKVLTDKFNDTMAFIKELCLSAATLIFAKNECRADLTKPQ